MTYMTRTWWGTKFMDALQGFMEEKRLKRGRSYSTDYRLIDFSMKNNVITAIVRGNRNPYFGVYKEPKYKVKLKIIPIKLSDWDNIIKKISKNAALISRLMLFEMPNNIESVFDGACFLPHTGSDIESKCSCPDWENPCKHVAGVYYRVSQLLDNDPFLMFQLRGLSKEILYTKLRKTDIGKALVSSLGESKNIELEFSDNFYARINQQKFDKNISLRQFWEGKKIVKNENNYQQPIDIPALVIKKQGDYPSFWDRDNSFFETMQEVYSRVQMKNKHAL